MANRRYSQSTPEPLNEAKKPAGTLTDGVPWDSAKPGDLLALDTQTKGRLERFCAKAVESWLSSASSHHANLRRWNDRLEGVIEETNFPWDGAANIHAFLEAMHVVTLHSVMARSILTVDPLWHVRSLDPKVRESAGDIEEGINYKAKSELNVVEAVRDALYNAPRDGLAWLQGVWAEETEDVETVIRVRSVQEFEKEFPTAEDAEMTPEAYEDIKAKIAAEATSESPYPVRFNTVRVDYKGPKFFVVDEADMVRAPMTASTLKECRVYGKKYSARIESVKDDAEEGKLWKSSVSAWAMKGRGRQDDAWKKSREAIEGISEDAHEFSDERDLFCLVVRFKMEQGGKECKMLVTYSHEQKRALGAVKYAYTRDCFIPFRIIRRPGRMLGVSVIERLEEISAEIDASINYEINSNTIEMAPMFKGNKSKVKEIDLDLEENWIKLGGVLWLDDPKDFEQLKIAASDKNAAKSLRQELMRYSEMLIGPTQLLSGRESPVDPDAPGNKTIALIQQSNMRIEDYINEFRLGFDELGDFIVEMYYQYGDGSLTFQDREGNVKEIQRDILHGHPKMSAHGVTANLSPETEFMKALQWFQILSQQPEIAANPERKRELLSYLMVSGRMPNREALLPPKPEVEEAQMKALEAEAEKRVMEKLIKAGVIPPPPPITGAVPPSPPPVPGTSPAVPAPALNGVGVA